MVVFQRALSRCHQANYLLPYNYASVALARFDARGPDQRIEVRWNSNWRRRARETCCKLSIDPATVNTLPLHIDQPGSHTFIERTKRAVEPSRREPAVDKSLWQRRALVRQLRSDEGSKQREQAAAEIRLNVHLAVTMPVLWDTHELSESFWAEEGPLSELLACLSSCGLDGTGSYIPARPLESLQSLHH